MYQRFLLSNVMREGEGAATGAAGAEGGQQTTQAATAQQTQQTATAFDWKANGFDDVKMATVQAKGWKDPTTMFESYVNLEKLAKAPPERLVRLPDANGTPDQWGEVYAKLGKPAKPEDYKIAVPEGADPAFAKQVAPLMHKANLTASQAETLTTEWNAMQTAAAKAQKEAEQARHDTEVKALKTAWGADFDMRTARVDQAAEAFKLSPDDVGGLKAALGPKRAMELLDEIGAKLGTEGNYQGGNGGVGFKPTAEQARAQLNDLAKDRNFAARFNSPDPETRSKARAEKAALEKAAYPG